MEVKIYNDGKGKSRSFEASVNILNIGYMVGFGKTEQKAVECLEYHITMLIIDFNKKPLPFTP